MKEGGMNSSICAIILAAGTSVRMGKPKQLLQLNGKPLLEHIIQMAVSSNFSEILTVIGCEASKIKKTITVDDPRFHWIVNEDYLSGQSTSLKTGISQIGEQHSGMMIFLGDLPFITNTTIQTIYRAGKDMLKENDKSFVIQPEYKGIKGHPVFLGHPDKKIFMELSGDHGAKAIMNKMPSRQSIAVEDDGILFDIDTPEDYCKAISKNESNVKK